ncbi:hypothetical protein T265_08206 [Opisthorchis viverrini]|uniref:Uncharacterized protein n=1 Tax=Opisthorchis viverrini TaxID=6198 RepID=A0A074ZL00_OPIVI|nr:hypothetical protein T265_08206 [Opisthorchis viverrini]KER24035.1 hypothetical protein T265_08206 [Opisthorchis viverrini]
MSTDELGGKPEIAIKSQSQEEQYFGKPSWTDYSDAYCFTPKRPHINLEPLFDRLRLSPTFPMGVQEEPSEEFGRLACAACGQSNATYEV